jgi:hypothetical protein
MGLIEYLGSPCQVHMRKALINHMATCGSLFRIKSFLFISWLILGASLPKFVHAFSELVLLHHGNKRMQVNLWARVPRILNDLSFFHFRLIGVNFQSLRVFSILFTRLLILFLVSMSNVLDFRNSWADYILFFYGIEIGTYTHLMKVNFLNLFCFEFGFNGIFFFKRVQFSGLFIF